MTNGDTSHGQVVSAKVAGKRRSMNDDVPASPAVPAPPSKFGMQTRQKRVLPSRSRRGGPGVGNCDVDVMILETRKRRFDSEPLIPASTKFLLTTKSPLVPPPSEGDSSNLALNVDAYGRYFDRPEVREACKYQQLIQTPEFTQLPDDALVGGRFRPRSSEEESADTSDAAYEKRHRKYETFEKRQRLREKEKLKHEQYKLKERIDQLRAMDTSAFLALPASKFSGAAHAGEHDEADTGLLDLPGAHVNGAAAYNEGERRRKEMLEIAHILEDRYKTLLPRDRKWAEKKEKGKRESLSARQSIEPAGESDPESEPGPEPYEESSAEEDDLFADDEPETPAPPEPEPEVLSRNDSDGESEVDFEARDKERSKKLKLRIRFPPRQSNLSTPTHTLVISPSKKGTKAKGIIQTKLPFLPLPVPPPKTTPTKAHAGRGANGRFTAYSLHSGAEDEFDGSASRGPPKKRARNAASAPRAHSPAPSRHSHGSSSKVPCALMVSAMRTAAAPSARKTHRHVTAFGVRVPQELEEIRDYELPAWLTSDESDEGDYGYSQYDGASATHSYVAPSERWQSVPHDMPPSVPLDED